MEKYIIKDFKRPVETIIKGFEQSDVSTVYEAQGKLGLMDPYLKPILDDTLIVGPAVTVYCGPGDNLMIHAAIEVCKPGDILVVVSEDGAPAGMIGDLVVEALMKQGVKGMIMDVGMRDVASIRKMGFPIWTKAVYSKGTSKSRTGWVNAPVVCGGEIVRCGDIIMADDDGVVVVRKEDAEKSLAAAKKRAEKEVATREKINKGEFSIDFYNLRAVLEKDNVVYYENEEAFQLKSKG